MLAGTTTAMFCTYWGTHKTTFESLNDRREGEQYASVMGFVCSDSAPRIVYQECADRRGAGKLIQLLPFVFPREVRRGAVVGVSYLMKNRIVSGVMMWP